ncbi:MAG: alpha/beta fold hydrolase [Candidatus Bilamarchaeaceae archaeon]
MLILHGWGANSESNWFPWLKKTLEKKGITVYAPDLPNSIWPNADEWINKIKKTASPFDNSLSIVGHSLGTVAALRTLETLDKKEKVERVILVSGFAKDLGVAPLSSFFKKPFDWKKIKQKSDSFIVIHSEDDEVVPFEYGKELAHKLDAKFITERQLGHLNAGIGNFTYPRIVELLGAKNED